MKKSLFTGALCLLASVAMPALGAGNAEAGKDKAAMCAACHGPTGDSAIADYPNLAGQHESYIAKQLSDLKSGARNNPLMSPMAAPLSDEDIADIAAYYSTLPTKAGVAGDGDLALGENIYRGGITSAQIPACIGCHGPSGSGNPAAKYPSLSGQNSAYIASSLKEFRSGARTNDINEMMRVITHRMSDAEISAVSSYIQGLH